MASGKFTEGKSFLTRPASDRQKGDTYEKKKGLKVKAMD